MFQQLDKYRISKGSSSYAEVPVDEVITIDNTQYKCVEYVITTNRHGVDRCEYCKLEDTEVCSKLRCSNARSDHAWVYFIQVNNDRAILPIPTHNSLAIPIKKVIVR